MIDIESFKKELHEIIEDKGFQGVPEVLRKIEHSKFEYDKTVFVNLRNQITQQAIQAAPLNYLTGLKAFVDSLKATHLEEQEKDLEEPFYPKLSELKNTFSSFNEAEGIVSGNNEDSTFKDLDDLVMAIEDDNCVLFIGPEISVDKEGNSLHDKFNKNLSNKFSYNTEDSFFMPNTETKLSPHVRKYYKKQFHEENQVGNRLLQILAQIPFSLIVSFCPDDSIHRIFNKYDIKHDFVIFDDTIKDIKSSPSVNNPVVFNALGSPTADKGQYIFTHKQFNEFLKKEENRKIPLKIGAKIKETTHYIFIGFSFDKWQYRLMMFELEFNNHAALYAFEKYKTKEINKLFLKEQFLLEFVNSNYESFAKSLLNKIWEQTDNN